MAQAYLDRENSIDGMDKVRKDLKKSVEQHHKDLQKLFKSKDEIDKEESLFAALPSIRR